MLSSTAPAQKLSADGAMQTFSFVSDQYFSDVLFHFAPTLGTQMGLHQYDTQLEDYSAATIQKQIAALHAYEKKLAAIDPSALDASVAADHTILLNSIRSQLLSLEVIRNWEKNPDNYSSGVTNSIFVLMERPFAPVEHAPPRRRRARKADPAGLRRSPQEPQEPAAHLHRDRPRTDRRPHQLLPERRPRSLQGSRRCRRPKPTSRTTNAAVIQSLKDYGAWMKSDLLPRSNGDYRLGADIFRKKLAYDEMVDIPLDHLLQIGLDDLHRNQAEFARIAKEVDPTKTPQEVLAELATIHPAPDKLLDAFHDTFDSLIAFIRAHNIITIPSDVQPTLEETPPFMRATTFASMDSPGPFETHSTKALFNVTLPEKTWLAPHVAEHMASFNVGTIISTSVHEAYPGHYVQFLWQNQFPSKVRKIIWTNSNVEGWAHYTEQMMLDEGYAAPPANATPEQVRESKLIRLGQLQDALLRDARFVNAIKLHTGLAEPNRSGPSISPSTSSSRKAFSPAPSASSKPSAAPPTQPTSTTPSASSRS